jgi:hypothetical protein
LTLNISLSQRGAYEGGVLYCVAGGGVQALDRDEGDATIHNSTLLHGVSRLEAGVRES